ncbi:DNA polymerase Y family protein [Luteimonas sp. BDR2-5]|uniref:Y-family DNA polymerase n=1 Tax=Proluteimonas luteida TaxID=2878685 RepID=UPI001E425407|nr:DNA polymerase Y family protein [Luteimonas sp. BDR2-5]MCD9026951.1 DNA polymerase Y family protein [Luteimonas sp. BDR2-5]
MRWACILLPQLALDAVLRRRRDAADTPLALVAGPAQRRVLHAVNPAGRARGLRPGLTLMAARALAADLVTFDHDPDAPAHWQRFLAAWAYRFSSQVSLAFPHALVLEVQASLGLFGPWPRFEARLRTELDALGFRHRIVAAPHPAAARALANVHDGLAIADAGAMRAAVAALPLRRAGFAPEVATALSRMGLRRVADVLALPRAGLGRRFPADVLRHLQRISGEAPLPLAWYRPPDRFDGRVELGFEVESHQALLFPLRRLTADLAAYLAGRDGGVQRFELRLQHEHHADTVVGVGLLGTEREAGMLLEVARMRLERAEVPAPVRGLRLIARELPAFAPEHRELFDARPQQSMPWEQLRERLRGRLGDAAVQGLQVHADHRPEHASRPASSQAPAGTSAQPPRPGWLLPQAVPLRAAPLRFLAGPERIESGWWDGDVRRDYYRVETRQGQQAWVHAAPGATSEFMLHGLFA